MAEEYAAKGDGRTRYLRWIAVRMENT